MDVNVNTANFLAFLKKCHMENIINDLVIHASKNQLFAKICDSLGSFYGEIYLKGVNTKEEGCIRINNLKKLIAIVNRCGTDMLKIKSNEDAFVITDGSGLGNMNSKMLQAADEDVIESYDAIKNRNPFDRKSLTYMNGKLQYKNGFEVPIEMLDNIIEDSKAFGHEIFELFVKKDKLRCKIENGETGEKFNRVIADKKHFGNISEINPTKVGLYFAEMIKTIKKTEKGNVFIFIDDQTWLITNKENVFYNLHTIDE